MKGKNVNLFEYIVGQTVDEFITSFVDSRDEFIETFSGSENWGQDLREKVDLKACVDAICARNGRSEDAYGVYRAVRRYLIGKHGSDMLDRNMSIQGFYLDILLDYLRLPSEYDLQDLVEYLIQHEMLLRQVVDNAFVNLQLSNRVYSFLYATMVRSGYREKIAAVTSFQSGRGGRRTYERRRTFSEEEMGLTPE